MRGALLADEQGLGKTVQSLRIIKKRPDLWPVVVVCPASIKWQWEAEAARHIGMQAEIINGMKVPRHRLLTPYNIIIINYTILPKWLDYIIALKPKLVIVDECQNISNPNSQRSEATFALCKAAKKAIFTSGTPMENRAFDLQPVLSFLLGKHPEIGATFKSPYEFGMRYCRPTFVRGKLKFLGSRREEELNQVLLENCMVRRLKKDVLQDLPSKTRSIVPLEIEDRKQYVKADTDFISWLSETSPHKAIRAAKAEGLVQTGYLLRLCSQLKLKSVITWLEEFLESHNDKFIVFGVHYFMLDALYERFKKIAVLVNGKTPANQREKLFDKFRNNRDTRMLIGNIKAAGAGWNGQVANHTVTVELPWHSSACEQAEDRTHRIGQKKNVNCYYLAARKTIEEDVMMLLQDKNQMQNSILDGGNAHHFNVYDKMVEIMAKRSS